MNVPTRALVLIFAASLLAACQGRMLLEARSGHVLDRDTGEAIASADVFQVYWGRGFVGEPRPVYALRWSTSDAEGAFRFESTASTEPSSWVRETDAAEYGFYHPRYGLVRSGAVEGEPLVLEGSVLDAAARRASEIEICGSRPADAVIAETAARHCDRPTRERSTRP